MVTDESFGFLDDGTTTASPDRTCEEEEEDGVFKDCFSNSDNLVQNNKNNKKEGGANNKNSKKEGGTYPAVRPKTTPSPGLVAC